MSYRLFNKNNNLSFPKAALNEHRITITFKDETPLGMAAQENKTYGTLVGYLNNEFEYTAKGNYTDVFGVTKIDSLMLRMFEDSIQRNIANYGLLTKKMYTNGESPTLTVNFRCWAADETKPSTYQGSVLAPTKEDASARKNTNIMSNPVIIANALINATLPRVSSESILMKESVVDAYRTVMVEGPYGGLVKGSVAGSDKSVWEQIKSASGGAVEGAKNLANGLVNILSKKPPVCSVVIGNIFEKDYMVVGSVDVKFSKEYYQEGIPLYGDFNVTLQSLFSGSVVDGMDGKTKGDSEKIFGSGLNKKSKNRVTFDDADTSPELIKQKITEQVGKVFGGGAQ